MPELPPPGAAADGQLQHPQVAYETTDAKLRPIVMIMVCTIALVGLIFAIVWYMFVDYGAQLDAQRKSPYPLATTPTSTVDTIPEPRLDQLDLLRGDEVANIFTRMKAKEQTLHSYGKTAETGFVHIPIDVAIKRLAGQLPVRKQLPTGPQHDNGLIDAGASNSGRLFRKDAP